MVSQRERLAWDFPQAKSGRNMLDELTGNIYSSQNGLGGEQKNNYPDFSTA